VVINKVDRQDARPIEVVNEVFDLFAALDATDEQLDFPILYGSAKLGWMAEKLEGPTDQGMKPLFELVLRHVNPPQVEDGPFRLLGTILEANPYLGRIVTGRITSGTVKPNQAVKVLDHDGKLIESGRITKVLAFRGLERVPIDEASAGDIVAVAGLPNATVAHTICAPEVEQPISAQPIDPPTLAMTFRVNDSPLAGTEGDKVTGRMIRDRLLREAEGDVALRVRESNENDSMEVAGRGELQLGILIETMRREGFELSVSRPKVLLRRNDKDELEEPIEEVVIDVDETHSGVVVQKMSERKAELAEMKPSGGGRVRLVFYAPTRGLIGYQSELLTDTRGTAIMNRLFHAYGPYKGEIAGRGELQLGILIETMRREGFELSVSRPKVLLKEDPTTGEMLEPIEEVVIDLDEEHSGIVVQKMAERKADMMEMKPSGGGRLRLVFHAPTRGLIGYQGELLTDTRGTAIMNRLFHAYAPYKGPIQGRRNGVLISNERGEAVAYALWNLEDRGPMMIEPGWKVYNGMIVGEHTRGNDLIVNVLKGKKLTNIRTTSKDEAVRLTPPIRMTLEKALAYIEDDELVEVTPKSIRLRKKLLDENDRKKEERKKEAETV
jgi:predicted membrane GTPase involved in stress response